MATSTAVKASKTKAPASAAAAKKVVVAKPRAKAAATKAKVTVAKKSATHKQVAGPSRRKASSVVHMTRDASFKLIDSQRAIWLAGLGALAKVTTSTGNRGEKAFEALGRLGYPKATLAK